MQNKIKYYMKEEIFRFCLDFKREKYRKIQTIIMEKTAK